MDRVKMSKHPYPRHIATTPQPIRRSGHVPCGDPAQRRPRQCDYAGRRVCRDGFDVYALSVDYGQRHRRELECAARAGSVAGRD